VNTAASREAVVVEVHDDDDDRLVLAPDQLDVVHAARRDLHPVAFAFDDGTVLPERQVRLRRRGGAVLVDLRPTSRPSWLRNALAHVTEMGAELAAERRAEGDPLRREGRAG